MIDLEFVGDYRQPQPTARQRELGFDGQNAGEFTFGDFIDIINPLQHIPGVSTLYREITGDEISPHARILGGTLFGGPTGFLSSIANALYDEIAGEDIGETALALFSGEEAPGGETVDPQAAALPAGAVPVGTAAGEVIPAGASSAEVVPTPPAAATLPASPETFAAGVPTGQGVLTGQDALAALFNDLRGAPSPGPTAPAAVASTQAAPADRGRQEAAATAKYYPLPPRPQRAAAPAQMPRPQPTPASAADGDAGMAVHPLILAQGAPDAAIADRMMAALDKYRTMSRQRHDEPAHDEPAREPASEEPRWQSDPAQSPDGES